VTINERLINRNNIPNIQAGDSRVLRNTVSERKRNKRNIPTDKQLSWLTVYGLSFVPDVELHPKKNRM